jgi:hypothetical protein
VANGFGFRFGGKEGLAAFHFGNGAEESAALMLVPASAVVHQAKKPCKAPWWISQERRAALPLPFFSRVMCES